MEMDRQMEESICTYLQAKPGRYLYLLSDEPGQTSGTAVELFRPASDQQEYCISTICADREGTLYYKNVPITCGIWKPTGLFKQRDSHGRYWKSNLGLLPSERIP